ncbi:hypothetical protein [Rhodanobacter sp. T12-5]|uniref:hypothetical protein n=1 Tax=Rhodanobacter sp. T12-5 TaxID=2024611 RepID=UPI0011F02188|nr:hypothetical protein [Rhodanobacter sp. T12-5]KAA0070777.1 hypothetical protein CIW53_05405 [Rhodanobacter sp. T12-5]
MAAIRLFRHPDCAKCARYARWHRRLDWLGRFEDATGVSPVGPLRPGEVVVQDLHHDTTLRGAAGFTLLCRQIPAYWLLLPLLRIPAVRRRVEREFNGWADGSCSLD